jgi:hypothetical protein
MALIPALPPAPAFRCTGGSFANQPYPGPHPHPAHCSQTAAHRRTYIISPSLQLNRWGHDNRIRGAPAMAYINNRLHWVNVGLYEGQNLTRPHTGLSWRQCFHHSASVRLARFHVLMKTSGSRLAYKLAHKPVILCNA